MTNIMKIKPVPAPHFEQRTKPRFRILFNGQALMDTPRNHIADWARGSGYEVQDLPA